MKKTEGYFSLERKEICEAIYNNDGAAISEMMKGFGFAKDGAPPHLRESMHQLASIVLATAAAAESEDTLTEETAQLIIGYTADAVSIFDFMHFMPDNIWRLHEEDHSKIPEDLKQTLREAGFTDQAAEAVNAFSKKEFIALLSYIDTDEVKGLDFRFSSLIINGLYKYKLVAPCLLLAYMGAALREPIPETIAIIADSFGIKPGDSPDDIRRKLFGSRGGFGD